MSHYDSDFEEGPCDHCQDSTDFLMNCVDCLRNYDRTYKRTRHNHRPPHLTAFCGKSWMCFGVICHACDKPVCKVHLVSGKHLCKPSKRLLRRRGLL